jgi:hypothetical protein
MRIYSVYASICYLMDNPETDLEKFLQDAEDLAIIHLVTGQLVKTVGAKTVYLRNVSI